jgi:GT2 family glycosyltransferase
VSVTVVLYNSAEHVERCIASIGTELDDGFAELIAVDNDSPDDSATIVRRAAPGVRVIDAGGNLGFARGVNLAWPHARGRYWFLLNPDVVVPPGGLRALVAWMDANPGIGVCSPEIGEGESAGRALPSISRALMEAVRLHRLLPTSVRGRLLRGSYWPGGDQIDAGWVPATAAMARREAVEDAGLLGESFFMYGEDMEWSARVGRAGWRIGVCSSVRVAHSEASSANASWGEEEAQLQMARGVREAVARIRGPRYAALYMRVEAVLLWGESIHPHRAPGQRNRSRAFARAWRDAA